MIEILKGFDWYHANVERDRLKGDAEKLVTRLRFGLIQVPVPQYTDINQISSKLYYDSRWRNFMYGKLAYDLLSFKHRSSVIHEHIAEFVVARIEMAGKVN